MRPFFLAFSFVYVVTTNVLAQPAPAEPVAPGVDPGILADSLLQDRNGNGTIDVIAFGDSLTRGTGDFQAANQTIFSVPEISDNQEAGYPRRLQTYFGIGISNYGHPGERLIDGGLRRFASTIRIKRPDVIIINEGSNDARDTTDPRTYFQTVQSMINIARAAGTEPVLWTIPRACCNHAFLVPSTAKYNNELETLGTINDVAVADLAQAYFNSCHGPDCFLLNRPEGLHPNVEGYDVIGEMLAGTLLGIDLLAPGGASDLESALHLPAGSVRTQPTPEAEEPTS